MIGQIVSLNPASSVRGPKRPVRKGNTPALAEARRADDDSDLRVLNVDALAI